MVRKKVQLLRSTLLNLIITYKKLKMQTICSHLPVL